MKFEFLQLGIKSNFLKLVQNNMYVSFMNLHVLRKNEDVINVMDHEIIQVFTKNWDVQ